MQAKRSQASRLQILSAPSSSFKFPHTFFCVVSEAALAYVAVRNTLSPLEHWWRIAFTFSEGRKQRESQWNHITFTPSY